MPLTAFGELADVSSHCCSHRGENARCLLSRIPGGERVGSRPELSQEHAPSSDLESRAADTKTWGTEEGETLSLGFSWVRL